MCRKHVMENDTEDQEISSETSLIKEHERLTAKYNSERALLVEALKASQKEQSPGEESVSKEKVYRKEEEKDGAEKREIEIKKEEEEDEEEKEEEEEEKEEEEEEEEEEEKEKEEADIPRFPKAIPLGPVSTDEPKSMEQNVSVKLITQYDNPIHS
ncbi:hypothetical protein K0M31_015049 [Melipona bicolor]|uniref:Uncharacterized protein n=1 Tax=Melipona bicolor TaxID=60889 RepID=A0AA40FG25_9HYME|nr:hypothetical protein K0M31_015049 [Melipona bicolor]